MTDATASQTLSALYTFYDGPIAPTAVQDALGGKHHQSTLDAKLCRAMSWSAAKRRRGLNGAVVVNDAWLARLSANLRYHRDRAIAELAG